MLAVPQINSQYTTTTQLGWKQNPNYLVTLYDNNKKTANENRAVQAYIPENFHFRIQNDWEPFLASLDNVPVVGRAFDTINSGLNSVGLNLNYKLLSALIWHRMDPINFSFTFLFDSGNGLNSTQESALENVTKPVMRLISMATPSRGTGNLGSLVLDAPGPTIAEPKNNITLKVGRFFYIDSVVIEGLDITWHTMAETSGDFIAADVEVNLKGWYAPDKDDILNYFGQGSRNDVANFIKNTNLQDYSKDSQPVIYDPTGGINQAFNDIKNRFLSYIPSNPFSIP